MSEERDDQLIPAPRKHVAGDLFLDKNGKPLLPNFSATFDSGEFRQAIDDLSKALLVAFEPLAKAIRDLPTVVGPFAETLQNTSDLGEAEKERARRRSREDLDRKRRDLRKRR